jgi:hypothetical protein
LRHRFDGWPQDLWVWVIAVVSPANVLRHVIQQLPPEDVLIVPFSAFKALDAGVSQFGANHPGLSYSAATQQFLMNYV